MVALVIKRVVIGERAAKQLAKCPPQVQKKLRVWREAVEQAGVEEVRKQAGYHDEPLVGVRAGQRSIRLSLQWRAFYVIRGTSVELTFVEVIEINPHRY